MCSSSDRVVIDLVGMLYIEDGLAYSERGETMSLLFGGEQARFGLTGGDSKSKRSVRGSCSRHGLPPVTDALRPEIRGLRFACIVVSRCP
jgi:hypothetical protein